MGMIIRVAFNNQNWSGKCKQADRDRRLLKCKEKVVDTGFKIDKKGNCLAECWESNLCKNYSWHRVDGDFNIDRANGNVFFVFPDIDNSLIMFAKSKVKEVIGNSVYFTKFKPLPQEKWVRGLTPFDLINKAWNQGTYRYIDTSTENKLINLIQSKEEYFDDPIEPEFADEEGKIYLKKHLIKERSTKLIKLFKNSLRSFDCKICGFNFEKLYGEIGANFIEAHHTKPLALINESEMVSIKDLIPVCSNCHRMIHRNNPPLDWRDLKKKMKQ